MATASMEACRKFFNLFWAPFTAELPVIFRFLGLVRKVFLVRELWKISRLVARTRVLAVAAVNLTLLFLLFLL